MGVICMIAHSVIFVKSFLKKQLCLAFLPDGRTVSGRLSPRGDRRMPSACPSSPVCRRVAICAVIFAKEKCSPLYELQQGALLHIKYLPPFDFSYICISRFDQIIWNLQQFPSKLLFHLFVVKLKQVFKPSQPTFQNLTS